MNAAKFMKVAIEGAGMLLIILFASTVCASATSSAQLGDAGRAVEQDARTSLQLGNEPVFVTRREDLEQDVTGLQFLLKSNDAEPNRKTRAMCIQIMDISRGGYKVANGFIMAAAVDLDDAPTWRSAYDCETGKIFHLYGFQDSNLGFNDLVKSQDLHIKTQSDALVLLSSFISLSYLDSPRAVMRDELDLMGAAIGDFRGVRSQAAFETYWRKCPHRVKSQIAQPSAKALSGGFEIVFFSYAKKQLHKNSIVCHDNGTLNDVVSKELFRW